MMLLLSALKPMSQFLLHFLRIWPEGNTLWLLQQNCQGGKLSRTFNKDGWQCTAKTILYKEVSLRRLITTWTIPSAAMKFSDTKTPESGSGRPVLKSLVIEQEGQWLGVWKPRLPCSANKYFHWASVSSFIQWERWNRKFSGFQPPSKSSLAKEKSDTQFKKQQLIFPSGFSTSAGRTPLTMAAPAEELGSLWCPSTEQVPSSHCGNTQGLCALHKPHGH